jgi:hypothetical protein
MNYDHSYRRLPFVRLRDSDRQSMRKGRSMNIFDTGQREEFLVLVIRGFGANISDW